MMDRLRNRIHIVPLLIIVTICFLTLRINHLFDSISMNKAHATSTPSEPSQNTDTKTSSETPAPEDIKPPVKYGGSSQPLSSELTERRKQLDDRSQQLDQREALLKATEERIKSKILELNTVKEQIDQLLAQVDDKKKAQIQSLVKIYENMKPKDAARIFNDLDMPVLMEVVASIKEAKMAPILALMDPAKAKEVTTRLAERKPLPDTPTDTAAASSSPQPPVPQAPPQ